MDNERYNQEGLDREYAKTSGGAKRNNYRNDQAVDLDDINLEDNADYNDDASYKKRSGVSAA
jgi:hypothetical protein